MFCNVPGITGRSTIARAVKASFDEEVAFVTKLVKAPSPNPYTPQNSPLHVPVEGEVPTLIFEKLKELGLNAKYVGASRERMNVVAEWGEKRGRSVLMLNGHMDTSALDEKRSGGSYSGIVRDGKIYGHGVLDMKATLAAYIYAVKALMECKVKISGKLLLAFVVDEESGASRKLGSHYLLENGCTPKACFIGEHGSRYIRIGQRGIYRFLIRVRGSSVHTGMSAWEKKELGRNAVVDMANVITALQDLNIAYKASKIFEGRRPVLTFPTKIEGGAGLNVVPDECVA
ncbi:MAG: M20 family peptidase, partial [Candidatus Moraniibacteriota bacterium]